MSLTPEQIDARRSGIGGSDLAAVLGVCPWRQPIDVFFSKRLDLAAEAGYEPDDVSGSELIFWGNVLEEPIATGYSNKTGRAVRKCNIQKKHPKAYWLLANIDRKVVGQDRGVEIKNVSWHVADRWGKDGSADVAEYYLPQVHQYLLVNDYPVWDVAALIGGNDLRIFEVERDPEWDDLILDHTADFWRRVEAGDPPPVDAGAANALSVLRRVYPGTSGEVISLDDGVAEWAEKYQAAGQAAKAAEAEKARAKAELLAAMGDAAIGVLPDGTGFRRRVVERSGYTVEPKAYVDFRFTKKPT